MSIKKKLQKDIFSKAERSWVMRQVRGKDTLPERMIRTVLHKMGYRFRLHKADLPGKPDIALPMYRTVIFVNGCFWHQHSGCKKATIPQNNRGFWQNKLTNTVKRDKETRLRLRRMGWKVITLWECRIFRSIELTAKLVEKALKQSKQEFLSRKGNT